MSKEIGYCVKCREKKEMTKTEKTVSAKGVNMIKGTCSSCGTKMCKIIGKEK